MVRDIVRDVMFLGMKSEDAVREDLHIAQDLLDTLNANRHRCVGLAANMIGCRKRIIAVSIGFADIAMINPRVVSKKNPYETVEGCLSLDGERPAERYEEIEVEYMDMAWKKRRITLRGFPAQICQHEIDHCEGIVI